VRHTKRRRPHSKLRTCFETLMPPGQPMMIEPKILPIFSGFQDQRGNWNAAILLTANVSTPCTGATAVDMHTALTADLTARHVITTSATIHPKSESSLCLIALRPRRILSMTHLVRKPALAPTGLNNPTTGDQPLMTLQQVS
jgi:hypothetical protein